MHSFERGGAPALTILTYPTLAFWEYPAINLKRIARVLLNAIAMRTEKAKAIWLGGHPGVTHGLLKGLKDIGIRYNINPLRVEDISSCVIVLAGAATLRQALRMKQEKIIRRIYAGPNIVIAPIEENRILENADIDKIIVPSIWVKELYEAVSPAISGKIIIWAAGVDTKRYWNPTSTANRNQGKLRNKVLLYKKRTVPEGHYKWDNCIKKCCIYLKKKGIRYNMIEYGAYTISEYRELLSEACGMIYWSDSTESQGIALIEAWAMGVKTYVAQNHYYNYKGKTYPGSSAPYLSLRYGVFFESWKGLEVQLASMKAIRLREAQAIHARLADKFSYEATAYNLVKALDISA